MTARKDSKTGTAYRIMVHGLVQGVGFRPFIYRLASSFHYKGFVENRTDGVVIVIETNGDLPDDFVRKMKELAPEASSIENINVERIPFSSFKIFSISPSKESDGGITEISPDIAVCSQCLDDMEMQAHRIHYPLINCTHCGPRFTIIKSLPYDRASTTMKEFSMCKQCKDEYHDMLDRRFHAQPVACNHCGPKYTMLGQNGHVINGDIDKIVSETARLIDNGKLVSLKGTGGYHLVCNAFDQKAVESLRKHKQRDGKPFALMFRNPEVIATYAYLSETEKRTLLSWPRPIVLLKTKKPLPAPVSNGVNTTGAILPYMPFHYMLFRELTTDAIVFTSGNLSEEPVLTDDPQALKELGSIADAVVAYNRQIYNRADDSVVRLVNNNITFIRRSRGYVPKPIALPLNADGILAMGAELKNTFCLGKKNKAILSQHIGDLKNAETFLFYSESLSRFFDLFRFRPSLIACDLHPNYLSTHHAFRFNVPVTFVQHHHAHIASCMAEYKLDEPVIGLAFDGTGLGDDDNIWGSEVMVASLTGYQRKIHLDYIPLPGGDKAIGQPWRMVIGLIQQYNLGDPVKLASLLFPALKSESILQITEMVRKQINVFYSCGLGRLFDVVATICGLVMEPTYEAEGPMLLESIADESITMDYPIVAASSTCIRQLLEGVLNDRISGVPVSVISAKFHNTIVKYAVDATKRVSDESGILKVVLSGGSFQNRFLAESTINNLLNLNFTVYFQHIVPPNDGGISLGQLAVAAKRREEKCV